MKNKTMKQIAEELHIDKQRVYRFIKKNRINEAYQKNGAKYYDEVAQKLIKQGFEKDESHREAHQNRFKSASNEAADTVTEKLIEMLEKELEEKNQQIKELNKLLDQQQQLNMKTMQELDVVREEKKLLLESKAEEEEKKPWWKIF